MALSRGIIHTLVPTQIWIQKVHYIFSFCSNQVPPPAHTFPPLFWVSRAVPYTVPTHNTMELATVFAPGHLPEEPAPFSKGVATLVYQTLAFKTCSQLLGFPSLLSSQSSPCKVGQRCLLPDKEVY